MIRLGLVLSFGAFAGCQTAPPSGSAATSSAASGSTVAAAASTSAAGPVAKVVFIGQREACECTRKRIDGTWAALEQALESHSEIQVEKLEQDVQQEAADRYDELKPMMVAPGVYLLDADGKLVELLQGELTATKLERALSGGPKGKS
jgi:hypothetical protein